MAEYRTKWIGAKSDSLLVHFIRPEGWSLEVEAHGGVNLTPSMILIAPYDQSRAISPSIQKTNLLLLRTHR
uniref:Uncharacterized protein n=1 Tax=Coccidioides posadasii RMSCC 3488 TaxID=454284 RepID=A0A0J6FIH5_COCPO|nr:hypothetical protein CPAG_05511 [Coccidioides posadasii RMSCC 3488]